MASNENPSSAVLGTETSPSRTKSIICRWPSTRDAHCPRRSSDDLVPAFLCGAWLLRSGWSRSRRANDATPDKLPRRPASGAGCFFKYWTGPFVRTDTAASCIVASPPLKTPAIRGENVTRSRCKGNLAIFRTKNYVTARRSAALGSWPGARSGGTFWPRYRPGRRLLERRGARSSIDGNCCRGCQVTHLGHRSIGIIWQRINRAVLIAELQSIK